MKRPFVVANWKMNLTPQESRVLALEFRERIPASQLDQVEVAVCPTFTALYPLRELFKNSGIALGAQSVGSAEKGAYTGEVSARELQELECRYTLVGHSERRKLFKESDADCAAKCRALLDHGIRPILCVGETEGERDAGKTEDVVLGQINRGLEGLSDAQIVQMDIAYEPVWAIGTGKTASPADAQAVHAAIRRTLKAQFGAFGEEPRILYGGSVTPEGAPLLIKENDIVGFLVGGASLSVEPFAKLIDIVVGFGQ